ncbi:MAG: (deoxy)nucleoside triphosphate pyrophosphohydrolase [Clostridiales Family XIII bacterium]|nr:(deoxy)nucleoside triphosphate pyrophosphohydrolase [Clostridiales Family XIII bacterium]
MDTIDVAAAIIIRNKKLLAAQRGYGDYAGWWEFPGGKTEPNETPEAALVREIREELDASVSVDSYFGTTEYDYPKFHLSMRCYLCTLAGDAMTLREHSAVKWLGADDIYSVKWLDADVVILEKLLAQGVL